MNEPTPAEIEATGVTVTVTYNGIDFELPGSLDDADGDVLDAVDDQAVARLLRALLGPQQWQRFKATRPKTSDYGALFDAYAKRIGLDSTGN